VRINLTTGEVKPLFSDHPEFMLSSCAGGVTSNIFTTTALRVRNLKSGAETKVQEFNDQRNASPSGRSNARNVQAGRKSFLSHDGRLVAFMANLPDFSNAIHNVPTEGGTARELIRSKPNESISGPLAWSPDDRFIYYVRSGGELFRIPSVGGAEQSTGLRLAVLSSFEISPDGKRIALAAATQTEIWEMVDYLPAK
jgi:hypothetical protein